MKKLRVRVCACEYFHTLARSAVEDSYAQQSNTQRLVSVGVICRSMKRPSLSDTPPSPKLYVILRGSAFCSFVSCVCFNVILSARCYYDPKSGCR